MNSAIEFSTQIRFPSSKNTYKSIPPGGKGGTNNRYTEKAQWENKIKQRRTVKEQTNLVIESLIQNKAWGYSCQKKINRKLITKQH